jgi:chemotaxis protein CheD
MHGSLIGDNLELSSHSRTLDVDTGDIKVSSEPAVIQAVALGSCVALAMYGRDKKIGGLAHIMLPGESPKPNNNTKFAANAVGTLLDSILELGIKIDDIEICVVGGANVLQEGDIPDKVIESVMDCLRKEDLTIRGMRVGGIERRSVFLDTMSGDVHYTEGDSVTRTLLTKIERI